MRYGNILCFELFLHCNSAMTNTCECGYKREVPSITGRVRKTGIAIGRCRGFFYKYVNLCQVSYALLKWEEFSFQKSDLLCCISMSG